MKIKVCGLREADNVKAIVALNSDYMGFIFYNGTPRFVGNIAINIIDSIPSNIIKTAVFVNEDVDKIKQIINKYSFDAIQLHGSEGPEIGAEFKGHVKVIKAFGINDDFNFEDLYSYVDHVDYFLFDTKTSIYGGSGETYDWALLDNYRFDVPFFLSGGLSLENLESVNEIHHPKFYGVDLNSRFEISPALKNIEKLEIAFEMLKQNDNQ
ncbi:phosphoribosylanthranilate isomerase [Mucilaginibacter sp.]